MDTQPIIPNLHVYRMSWTAIIIGALVGLGLTFLINLFGVAIHLSTYGMRNGSAAFAIGGLLGLLIGAIVAMFTAGFTSGYLGRCYARLTEKRDPILADRLSDRKHRGNLGITYGFATWAVSLILSALLSVSLAQYVQYYSKSVSRGIFAAAENQTPGMDPINAAGKSLAISNPNANANSNANGNGMNNGGAVTQEDMKGTPFILFALFFLGALACCLGAYSGMVCEDRSRLYEKRKEI